MRHNSKFLSRVDQARRAICECTVDELIQAKNEGKSFTLIDVREEREFAAGHIPGAIHLSKGVIERDIESSIPDQDERLVLYCGGGYRSAIAAESLLAMGYTNVTSMDGGWRGWMDAEQPVER
jgi:rhodanese-related sulfurtransferase